ncbi:GNAT family N-acetyltransferase [Methylobacterium isbiliense]|uniref:BioF2-like acetyltransferase domain-containing protein n=1 Tax=Methylobacterium isbiliense TaxID=315478 RepID=A0ABQ4SJK0_9HYPH|nr:GNAT family N-acetyltransferase [Methylobacterium isbiliense]GJE03386.1 hypothetical protein GMJLKIPL_5340 [Methylobacterium isbiliense]
MAAGAMPEIAILDSLEAIDACAQDWRALQARTPEATGFQSYAWCRTWVAACRQRGHAATPRVIALRVAGRLVMLWPLMVERRFGARIARWIGEPITPYGDVLAEPGPQREVWIARAAAVMRGWDDVDLVHLGRLRDDGVLARSGAAPGVPAGAAAMAPQVPLPRRDPPCTKSRRRRLRLLARDFADDGPPQVEAVPAGAAARDAVRAALGLKAAWLAQRGLVSAGLSHPVVAPFLEEAAAAGDLAVHRLRVGPRAIAYDLGLSAGPVYRSLVGSFDPAYARYAPGHAMTAALLHHLSGQGAALYDFLPPDDTYKTRWATGRMPVRGRVLVLTARGRAAAFALVTLRGVAKRLYRRLPGGLRRLTARRRPAARVAPSGLVIPAS